MKVSIKYKKLTMKIIINNTYTNMNSLLIIYYLFVIIMCNNVIKNL